ncbi:MAG: DUF58 domain-containing protein [Chitinispirillaceae bacterium]|nr:DUF58 domain-containing protein [Chitinispirillaceae bacterium]
MKTATLIRPEHLVAIRNLSLCARLIVEGMIAGQHKSPFHGFSVEFLEYRAYLPGESTKAIDWRKYARTDRAVVKLFEDETNLRAWLMLDTSGSMGFSSRKAPLSKLEYAKALVASLAWILVRQRDATGLAVFDEEISALLPPRSTNVQLKAMLAALDTLEPGGRTRCGNAIDTLADRIRKRGLCVLVSDLFDDPQRIIHGLRHLRFKGQDVIVLWIMDPLERSGFDRAPLKLRDLETGERLSVDGETASRFLREGVAEQYRILEEACRELAVDLDIVTTDEPFQKALFRIMEKRKRVG